MVPVHILLPLQYFHFSLLLLHSHFLLVLMHFRFLLALLLFLWRRFSFDFFEDVLVSFFELGLLNFNVFSCFVAPFMLHHVVFSFYILEMVTLSRRGDRESCHDTSVVTSHVDHVVGFGVIAASQVSSLG